MSKPLNENLRQVRVFKTAVETELSAIQEATGFTLISGRLNK